MATPSISPTTSLQLKRTFQAERQRVFQAWTDPQQMRDWSAPTGDYEVTAAVDLRVGGKYRIQMKHKNGNVSVAHGEYREVQPPERLVYTWSWEDGKAVDTLVTVEFRDLGGATEVVLTHERFASAEWRDKHSEGWSGCLLRLESLFQR
jgi:uncharacterized protein YndB with AHSA1/START domain